MSEMGSETDSGRLGLPARLGVLGSGLHEVLVGRAARELAAELRRDLRVVSFHLPAQVGTRAARHADDAVVVRSLDADPLLEALETSGVDAVWGGRCAAPDLSAIAEKAGVRLLGPDSGSEKPGDSNQGAQVIEVDVARDVYSRVEILGARRCIWPWHSAIWMELIDPSLRAILEAARTTWDAARIAGVGTLRYRTLQGEAVLVSMTPVPAPLAIATEAMAGLDLTKLALGLALGARLDPGNPPGGAAAAALLMPEESAPDPWRVELLHLPGGPGITVGPAAAEGDDLPPTDRIVATIAARGDTAAEATGRLARALEDSALVTKGASSNRPALLRLVGRGTPADGAEAALVLAAIEEFAAARAEQRALFFRSAARGRPDPPESGGIRIELRHGGRVTPFVVRESGPGEFEIEAGGSAFQARLAKTGPFQRTLRTASVVTRALVAPMSGGWQIEIGAATHRVERADAGLVVSPAPAIVIDLRVHPRDHVEAGDPVATVEAMKMEITLAAERPGVVRWTVGTNVQVSAGEAIARIDPEITEQPAQPAPPLSFISEDKESDAWTRALADMRRLCLGYDTDGASVADLAARWSAACSERTGDGADLVEAEDEILATFADLRTLDGVSATEDAGIRARPEPFLAYLRTLDRGRADLSPAFVEALDRLLARQGCSDSAQPSATRDEAVFRVFRAWHDGERQAPTIAAILDRRLAALEDGAAPLAPGLRDTLDAIVAGCHRTFPALADDAREVRYRAFDQALVEQARDYLYTEADQQLDRLETGPEDQIASAIDALVTCPQPLVGTLVGRLTTAGHRAGRALLETLVRRYYRIRPLENVRTDVRDGRLVAFADYEHEGARVRLISTFALESGFADAVDALVPLVAHAPAGGDVITDYYLWRDGPAADADATAERIANILDGAGFSRRIRRVVVTATGPRTRTGSTEQHFTFRHDENGFTEERVYRGLHPMMGKRLELWRLANFDIERLPSVEDVYLFRAVARDNPKDERLVALTEVRDLTPSKDADGRVVALPHLERMVQEALASIRRHQAHRPDGRRLMWNRVLLHVWPPVDLSVGELFGIVRRLAPETEGLGLQKVLVRGRWRNEDTGELDDRILHISNPVGTDLTMRFDEPATTPIRPLTEYVQRVVQCRQRGLVYPYELVRMLTADQPGGDFPTGTFVEHDLDDSGERLVPVERPPGKNAANIVVGVIRNVTRAYPEGMTRVAILGDPSRALGSLAEPECRRINAALDLAERLRVPAEWFAVSAGAKISMDSGTENMDWIARTLRRIIEFTQAGGELNVIVCGINVGAQPYWNAEATMLMHTKGILVMTPDGAMVLTGKQALDYSGGVSADDNFGIGGYDRVMGPNGQAQYWAEDLAGACHVLLRHYAHTYVAPGERFPRRVPTSDPVDRDVAVAPHAGEGFRTVGEILSESTNPDRKRAFDIRSVMSAVADVDHPTLERWEDMLDAETVVVWDTHLGGRPVCLLGIESKPRERRGFIAADGPSSWTAGTLFPRSSKKAARAINAASGNRPVVVLANLTGFDGSPESLRELQLEYGAEIGRAVVNFRGPFVFCVISRYHGGAFVVFSAPLNDSIEIAAVEGSYASVIGGAPAAAVVFAREVESRTRDDERVAEAEAALAESDEAGRGRARRERDVVVAAVRSEKLGEVAAEFDHTHSIYRAQRVGSVHTIIPASRLRPYLVEAVERGISRTLEGSER
jgi:acetyl-CoA carboxylase carboxyltransferase component/biotin carboxyl carrier protein/biotin carboxylase